MRLTYSRCELGNTWLYAAFAVPGLLGCANRPILFALKCVKVQGRAAARKPSLCLTLAWPLVILAAANDTRVSAEAAGQDGDDEIESENNSNWRAA